MIKIICGPKGTGKTKKIIDAANAAFENAKGNIVFITDTDRYMYDIRREVKFINVANYNVAGEEAFCGFVKGVIAGNRDIEDIFVDGCARITGRPLAEMSAFFYLIDKVSEDCNLSVTLTCSAAKEDLPPFIAKYL